MATVKLNNGSEYEWKDASFIFPKRNDIVILRIIEDNRIITEVPALYTNGLYEYLSLVQNRYTHANPHGCYPYRDYYWRYLTPLESITITQD